MEAKIVLRGLQIRGHVVPDCKSGAAWERTFYIVSRMKNYYSDDERKFTFAKLEIRPLTKSDKIVLAVAAGLCLIQKVALVFSVSVSLYVTSIAALLSMIITPSPFGLRYRVKFSAIWLALSVLMAIKGGTVGFIPLIHFLLYHLLRWGFWRYHNLEFTPFYVGRGSPLRYVSKVEGRGGYREDRIYTINLNWLCLATFLVLMFVKFSELQSR
jgi:hypothetical protein